MRLTRYQVKFAKAQVKFAASAERATSSETTTSIVVFEVHLNIKLILSPSSCRS